MHKFIRISTHLVAKYRYATLATTLTLVKCEYLICFYFAKKNFKKLAIYELDCPPELMNNFCRGLS